MFVCGLVCKSHTFTAIITNEKEKKQIVCALTIIECCGGRNLSLLIKQPKKRVIKRASERETP